MAQADQTIQNDTFPAVRSDINNNLAALFSNNSGTTAPTTTVAYMDWIDTSGANPIWKKRNAANNAWVTLGTIVSNSIAFEGTLPSQSGQSGKYLTTDGTTASWGTVTAVGQLLRAPQTLLSGTSYTTPANCTTIYIEAVGGGGGGGGSATGAAGGGGGGGGFATKYFTVTPSTSYTYAIGAGGNGGSSGNTGSGGGNTTFTVGATTVTAAGGNGGGASTSPGGGSGGGTTNADLGVSGGGGAAGNTGSTQSGAGGMSFFGGGGRGISSTSNNGAAGSRGGGGSGAAGTTSTGGNGGNGIIRVWEYS